MRRASFRILTAALAATALALASEHAFAQESFDITIQNRGQPAADVEVLMLVNQAKTSLGRTNAQGSLGIDMSLINIPKTTQVDVYEIECDDVTVIVVVAPGEEELLEEECERRRRENPNCECRRIGAFVWGDGNVTIDVGTNTVTTTPFEQPAAPVEPTSEIGVADLLAAGVTFGAIFWPEFENVAARAGATDATKVSPFVGGHFEGGIPGTGIRLGAGFQWSPLDVETPDQTGEGSYLALGPHVRWRFGSDMARTAPYVFGRAFHAWNKFTFRSGGVSEDRTLESWRVDFGGGVEFYLSPRFGGWAEMAYSPPADDGDADEHLRVQVGVSVYPGRRCGGSCIR